MEFFTSAVGVLQTLVIALGAGLGIWGAINLLEGYGNDNPGAKSQGNIVRMDNVLAGIPSRQENSKTQLENLYNQQESAKVEVKKPFPLEDELSQKSARLAELDALLNMDEHSSLENKKEERPSVLAELKKHSEGIVPERNKADMEVAL